MIDWFYDTLPGDSFADNLRSLREARGPIAKVSALGGAMPVYYIIGHQALSEAFKNAEKFPPGHAYQIISLPFIGETFMSMNEKRHREWRPAMTPSFRRHAVDKMDQGELAVIGHSLLDQLEVQARKADDRGVDLVSNFTRLFAFRVICKQLGLPIESERDYYQWSMDLMFGGRNLDKSKSADKRLTQMVRSVVAQRKSNLADDQISRWLGTHVNDQPIDDASILSHIRLFFTAGATTTSDAMGNLFHALLTQGDTWRQCVEQPDLQEGALQELLRWNPPVAAQPRFTSPDQTTEFFGQAMPPNSAVLFGVAAANRDPDVFPDPDRFDITRNAKNLLTFGPGLRTCPGMHLAQKNLACALKIMAERFPNLKIAKDNTQSEGVLLRGTSRLFVSM